MFSRIIYCRIARFVFKAHFIENLLKITKSDELKRVLKDLGTCLTWVTPLQRLLMWEHTVLTAANSFFLPNHFSTRTVFLSGMEMSTAKCLKLLIKVPRGPLTVTTRDLTLASTSSGIVTDWLVLITFILKSKDKMKS